jgi:hypothetical protein
MPIDYKQYPIDWKDIIRPDILKRDGYKCVFCKQPNRMLYVIENNTPYYFNDEFTKAYYAGKNIKIKKVVLTIMHLDQNITNNNYSNLASGCQRCHLKYDKKQHIVSRLSNKGKQHAAT